MTTLCSDFETVQIFCNCNEQDALDALGWVREFSNSGGSVFEAIELLLFNAIN